LRLLLGAKLRITPVGHAILKAGIDIALHGLIRRIVVEAASREASKHCQGYCFSSHVGNRGPFKPVGCSSGQRARKTNFSKSSNAIQLF
jgi:hypothetical protein